MIREHERLPPLTLPVKAGEPSLTMPSGSRVHMLWPGGKSKWITIEEVRAVPTPEESRMPYLQTYLSKEGEEGGCQSLVSLHKTGALLAKLARKKQRKGMNTKAVFPAVGSHAFVRCVGENFLRITPRAFVFGEACGEFTFRKQCFNLNLLLISPSRANERANQQANE